MKNTPSSTAKTAPISVRLPRALNRDLDKIAARLDRSRSWVIADAVDAYIDMQKEQIAMIEEGIRQADAGMGVPHEEVGRRLKIWRKTRRASILKTQTSRRTKR
jgi:predicted transcriptional regulator